MFRLNEPDKDEYLICVSRERFVLFDLFYTDAGYKTISGKPLDKFANHYGYFRVYKSDKMISFCEMNMRQEKEYGLMELIEKVV